MWQCVQVDSMQEAVIRRARARAKCIKGRGKEPAQGRGSTPALSPAGSGKTCSRWCTPRHVRYGMRALSAYRYVPSSALGGPTLLLLFGGPAVHPKLMHAPCFVHRTHNRTRTV